MTDGTAFWNRIADRYAAMPLRDAAGYESMLADVSTRLAPTDRVLEVGCGTGSTAVRLGALVAEWRATDFSPEMLRIARLKPAPPGVSFTVAEADRRNEGAPFDAICAFHILHLVPDTGETLRQLHAQLKPGGLLVSKTYCFADMGWRMRGLMPVLRLFGLFPPAAALTEVALRQAILDAGFEIELCRTFGSNRHSPYIVARRPS